MSLMQISAQTNPHSQVYPEMRLFFTQVLFLKADKKKQIQYMKIQKLEDYFLIC